MCVNTTRAFTDSPHLGVLLLWLHVISLMTKAPSLLRYSFWEANGYLVVPGAVGAERCSAAADAIYRFVQAERGEVDSWRPTQ